MDNRITKLEGEVRDIRFDLSDIKSRIAVAETNIKDIKDDLKSIKSNTTWIIRLIIAAIILAVLGFIFQGGLMP